MLPGAALLEVQTQKLPPYRIGVTALYSIRRNGPLLD
jgi:hypothetical protein